MLLVHQRKEAQPGPIECASSQITYRSTESGEQENCNSHAESLQRGFRALGLCLHELFADEMAITGPGFPARMVPDRRAAHCLLRQLRGVA